MLRIRFVAGKAGPEIVPSTQGHTRPYFSPSPLNLPTGKQAKQLQKYIFPSSGREGIIQGRQEPRAEDTRPGDRQIPRESTKGYIHHRHQSPTSAGGLVS